MTRAAPHTWRQWYFQQRSLAQVDETERLEAVYQARPRGHRGTRSDRHKLLLDKAYFNNPPPLWASEGSAA